MTFKKNQRSALIEVLVSSECRQVSFSINPKIILLSGRLCLQAFAVQSWVTGEGPYANWAKHVSDPFGYNLLSVCHCPCPLQRHERVCDAKFLILIDLVNQARALDHVLAATILEAHASCR